MSKLLAHDGVDFASVEANHIRIHDGNGFNVEAPRAWANDGTQWTQIFPGEGNQDLPAGTYILQPTSISIQVSAFAEFDTTPYRGRITEIRERVSWGNTSSGQRISCTGRPGGNFYRTITSDQEWNTRTIDHRIDTFDATSLTDFNTGASIGFTNSNQDFFNMSAMWDFIQLSLTIV